MKMKQSPMDKMREIKERKRRPLERERERERETVRLKNGRRQERSGLKRRERAIEKKESEKEG